ncbi:MAG TPA: MFS transporter, partial [Rhizomicrobium sp.]|nr:MFS transporter [Rhizomicrobium sp.]
LDQTGAIIGPLITSFVLARHGDYRAAYGWLAIPAVLTMLSVAIIAVRYSFAGHIAQRPSSDAPAELTRAFWFYAASAGLLGFGFADFSLIAYHFAQASVIPKADIPIFYAIAMGASGAGALVFGLLFDRRGLVVMVPVILLGAIATPLVFLGQAVAALGGTILWGMAVGTQNALMSASVAKLVPETGRARAYGLFSALFGISWFVGSSLLGFLYDHSLVLVAVVAIAAQLLSIIPLIAAIRVTARS